MSASSRIEIISGRAMALRGNDIDTDRIIPARFLKAITFDGIEAHLFEDDRRSARAAGTVHPFDSVTSREASILLVNANFGCGSSREHAPQALRRRGIRALVGESFADIFFSNAVNLGLACLTADPRDIAQLMTAVHDLPALEIRIDIARERITAGTIDCRGTLPGAARRALVTGQWDAMGQLLADYDDVARVARALPYVRGF